MRILPPDQKSTRARFVDWLEVLALTSSQGRSSLAEFHAVLRIEASERLDSEEEQELDTVGLLSDIANKSLEDLQEKVVEEIELREEIVGLAYPFSFAAGDGRGGSLTVKPDHLCPKTGRLFYVFCLLDSALRDDLLLPATEGDKQLVRRIGNVFQICACLAVGGYLDLEVVSFGFPRASGDGFLPALKAVWERYGSFKVRESVEYGFDDKLKDGGVDIIAWRHFGDRYAGTILMFAQVASGMDWKNKSVSSDVEGIKKWFHDCFANFIPAICIPFPLWFDLPDPPKTPEGKVTDFRHGIRNRFVMRESVFGVIFDRGRIAQASAAALTSNPEMHPPIDGIDRIGEVAGWVRDVLHSLGVTVPA